MQEKALAKAGAFSVIFAFQASNIALQLFLALPSGIVLRTVKGEYNITPVDLEIANVFFIQMIG